MPTFRLVFLLAIVAGLITAVATSSTVERRERERTATTTKLAPPPATPSRTVDVKLPHKGPIRVHVGDSVNLTVTLKSADVVVLDAFGLEQTVGPNIPTLVPFLATTPGKFPIQLQQAGTELGQVEATEPKRKSAPASGGTGPASR